MLTDWRKSSYSATQGQCVEVALGELVVGVRDSREPGRGVLVVSREAFRGLVALARR